MSFFKDVFSNFFAFITFILGLASIGFAFVSCVSGSGGTASWVPFLIFFVVGVILLSVSRALAKRG